MHDIFVHVAHFTKQFDHTCLNQILHLDIHFLQFILPHVNQYYVHLFQFVVFQE